MKLATALAALLISSAVHAQTCPAAIPDPVPSNAVRLSWTAPTQNTDGSAITKAITYTVYEGATAKCTTAATAGSLTGLSVGLHTWAVSAKTSDGESAKSTTASKTVPPSPPNPPTSLLVDPASLTAYKQRDMIDGFAMVPIGTVAPGTMCNSALEANGYNIVPRASVTLASRFDTLPLKVFAKCS